MVRYFLCWFVSVVWVFVSFVRPGCCVGWLFVVVVSVMCVLVMIGCVLVGGVVIAAIAVG